MGITQTQIAKLAGVSRATVDRVVNHRGHVKPDVEARIQRIIEENGYTPNPAGRQLVRTKRPMRIAYVLHTSHSRFLKELLMDAVAYSETLKTSSIDTDFFAESTLDIEKQVQVLSEIHKSGYDGVILMPANDKKITRIVDSMIEDGIPVVTYNADLPDSKRICYVGEETLKAGKAAAGLMGLLLRGGGDVLPLTGWNENLSGQMRIKGFSEEVKRTFRKINLLPLAQTRESDEVAYGIVKKALTENPKIKGIYLSSDGYTGVCRALSEIKTKERVRFVCHDYIKKNIENIKAGHIDFVIDQDSHTQATAPFDILKDYFLTGTVPKSEYMYTKIEYRNIYNLS